MQVVDLESKFISVFADLPNDVVVLPYEEFRQNPEWMNAAFRYWSVAHAEWMATKKSHNTELRDKWNSYYALVQTSAFRHPGLRGALRERLEQDPALRSAWHEYVTDLAAALPYGEAPEWLHPSARI